MAAPDTAALAPFALPLRREPDAVIADANGQTVLIIDPSRNLDEDAAERIADLVFARLTAAPVREEGGAVEAVGANAGSVNGRLVHAIDLIAKGLYLARGGTEDAYKVEGGEGPSVYGAGKVHRRINEVRGEAYRVVMAWRKSDPFSSKPALPTREEAPAEVGEVLDLLTHAKDAVHKIAALRRKIGPIASQAQTAGWAITLAMRHLRAQPQARPWGWDYEICTGCSASLTEADIEAGGHVSCCPERRMVTVQALVDAYEAQRKPQAGEKLRAAVEALEKAKDQWAPPLIAPDEVCEAGGQMDPVTGWLSAMMRHAFGIRSAGGRLKRMVNVIVAAEALAALQQNALSAAPGEAGE